MNSLVMPQKVKKQILKKMKILPKVEVIFTYNAA